MILKKRSQLFFLLELLLIIIFLSSCSMSSSSSTKSHEIKTKIYGTDGISYKLTSLSDNIFDNSKVQFVYDLKNVGAFDSNIVLTKPLYNEKYISDSELKSDYEFNRLFQLNGRSVESNNGEEARIPLILSINPLSFSEDQHTESVTFSICYSYKTIFDDDFCVDTDVFNLKNSDKTCVVSPKSYSKGQGAPVSITSVSVTYEDSGDYVNPVIDVNLKNTGSGIILTGDGFNKLCRDFSTKSTKLKDSVVLSSLEFSTYTLNDFDCSQEINFLNDESKFHCKLKPEISGFQKTDSTFLSKLHIELSYFYRESISKDLLIQKNN